MHRVLNRGEWWLIERERDPGYLGCGSIKSHRRVAGAVVHRARQMRADPAHRDPLSALEPWGWMVAYEGWRYSVINEAAWQREQERRASVYSEEK